jgi:hypothetical protein
MLVVIGLVDIMLAPFESSSYPRQVSLSTSNMDLRFVIYGLPSNLFHDGFNWFIPLLRQFDESLCTNDINLFSMFRQRAVFQEFRPRQGSALAFRRQSL